MMKYLASNHALAGKKRYFSVTSSGTRKISLFPISKSLENLSFFLSSLFRFLPYTGPIKTEEGETDMNGWDLAEVLFPVLGMVEAVNLLIQFSSSNLLTLLTACRFYRRAVLYSSRVLCIVRALS